MQDFPFEESRPQERPLDMPSIEKNRCRLIIGAIFPFFQKNGSWIPARPELVESAIQTYENLCKKFSRFHIVRTVSDLQKEGTGILLHIEGSDFLSSPEELTRWHARGIRSIGLTWNHNNQFAAGCNGSGGITQLGEALLAKAESLHLLLDLVHLNEQSFVEASQFVKRPFMVSHTAIRSLSGHPQALTDNMLDIIAKTQSIIGFGLLRTFYGHNATAETVAQHIEYARKKMPLQSIALGTDFFGFSPEDGIPGLKTLDDITAFGNTLMKKGWTSHAVQQFMGTNAYAFLNTNLA